jgi:uncharacterized protein (DUF58 family)
VTVEPARASVLSASAVAAIDDLELAARLTVEGFRSGQHRSPFHGYTAEFSQHRPYRPGDDLKHLDWKLLARTDRLYSRQFREATSMSVMLVVDASASMAFPEPAAAVVSKFRYAVIVAAALAHLIVTQGDAVGLMTMSDGRWVYLPAKGGRPHLRALLGHLARLEPRGQWALDRALARAAGLLKRRGVLLALSDFYEAADATFRELRLAARRGHDVALLQVMSHQEIAFPYARDIEFEDLESGERRIVDAGTVAATYRGGVGDFLERCRAQALRDGFDYALLQTDAPPEQALRRYLLRREAAASAPSHTIRSGA